MKIHFLPLLILVALFSGCSHIQVVGFDKEQKTVSIQADGFYSEEDIHKKAEEHCGGPVTLLRMEQSTIGSRTSTNVQMSGNTASVGTAFGNTAIGNTAYDGTANGSSTTEKIKTKVYTFSCKK